jgi:hypothetical protein
VGTIPTGRNLKTTIIKQEASSTRHSAHRGRNLNGGRDRTGKGESPMTNLEKALVFGAVMTVLYLVYTDLGCNRFCKSLVGGMLRTGIKQLV